MRNTVNAYQRGFTIVELLIVIVVIAILAAISIVAFNGVQLRAEQQKTSQAFNAYQKAMLSYASVNSSYPLNAGNYCLGTGYPDTNSDGRGECVYVNGSTAEQTIASVEDSLKNYGGGAQPSLKMLSLGTTRQESGVRYSYSNTITVDDVPNPWMLSYLIEGKNIKCSDFKGGLYKSGNAFYTTAPANWSGISETWTGGITCFVPLPDPAKR